MTLTPTNPFFRYAALGWSVIPVKRGTKVPYADLLPEIPDPDTEGGTRRSWKPFQERHPTPAELAEWGNHPANVAIVVGQVSGIIVLDLDSELAMRAATERGLPRTATARSSKGVHLYFKHPGGRVRNYREAAEQWDLKGDGGVVNAPPSIHPTGVVYEWEVPPEDGIAEAPAWLLQIIRDRQERDSLPYQNNSVSGSRLEELASTDEAARRRGLYFERALANAVENVRQAGAGHRNHTLNSVAYSLGQLIAGASEDRANPDAHQDAERLEAQIRQDLAATAHQVGLSRREADLTMTSGIRSGKQKPRPLPDFTTSSLANVVNPSSPRFKTAQEAEQKGATDRDVNDRSAGAHPTSKRNPKGRPAKPSEANLLIELGLEATFFHTDTGERYARYPVTTSAGSRIDTALVNHPRSAFRLWLHRRFYEVCGEPPGSNAMSQALQHLEQYALFDGKKRDLFTRLGTLGDTVYLNIGDEARHIVRMDKEGWEVTRDAPILFRMTENAGALPLPVRGGSIAALRPYVNLARESDWKLVVGWMVGALNPWGPYAHLALRGEQDTGKSTLLRLLRTFTDPARAEENSDPKTEDDFMVTALNNHVVSYDNLSAIPNWLSDALCRLATGAGLIKRKLYKDDEELVIAVARPALLNGIVDVITRPDLLDRTMVLELAPIDAANRLTERVMAQRLRECAPQVMGALLDGVVMALRRQDEVCLPRLPRMADFVTWVEAAAPALGWREGEFLEAFEGNVCAKEESALETDEVAQVLVQWADEHVTPDARPFTLTAKALFDTLSGFDTSSEGEGESPLPRHSPEWPRTVRDFSIRLTRATPILRKFGVEVAKGARTRKGAMYHIARGQPPAQAPIPQ